MSLPALTPAQLLLLEEWRGACNQVPGDSTDNRVFIERLEACFNRYQQRLDKEAHNTQS